MSDENAENAKEYQEFLDSSLGIFVHGEEDRIHISGQREVLWNDTGWNILKNGKEKYCSFLCPVYSYVKYCE